MQPPPNHLWSGPEGVEVHFRLSVKELPVDRYHKADWDSVSSCALHLPDAPRAPLARPAQPTPAALAAAGAVNARGAAGAPLAVGVSDVVAAQAVVARRQPAGDDAFAASRLRGDEWCGDKLAPARSVWAGQLAERAEALRQQLAAAAEVARQQEEDCRMALQRAALQRPARIAAAWAAAATGKLLQLQREHAREHEAMAAERAWLLRRLEGQSAQQQRQDAERVHGRQRRWDAGEVGSEDEEEEGGPPGDIESDDQGPRRHRQPPQQRGGAAAAAAAAAAEGDEDGAAEEAEWGGPTSSGGGGSGRGLQLPPHAEWGGASGSGGAGGGGCQGPQPSPLAAHMLASPPRQEEDLLPDDYLCLDGWYRTHDAEPWWPEQEEAQQDGEEEQQEEQQGGHCSEQGWRQEAEQWLSRWGEGSLRAGDAAPARYTAMLDECLSVCGSRFTSAQLVSAGMGAHAGQAAFDCEMAEFKELACMWRAS
ncbi:MAG: hypothetical protein J3K34DRAFT_519794 [Monoraphidium minutum]|nr:MAG: hypothetical protein J3K34DRAFT_519794 [Monoraphidium minutum]